MTGDSYLKYRPGHTETFFVNLICKQKKFLLEKKDDHESESDYNDVPMEPQYQG